MTKRFLMPQDTTIVLSRSCWIFRITSIMEKKLINSSCKKFLPLLPRLRGIFLGEAEEKDLGTGEGASSLADDEDAEDTSTVGTVLALAEEALDPSAVDGNTSFGSPLLVGAFTRRWFVGSSIILKL